VRGEVDAALGVALGLDGGLRARSRAARSGAELVPLVPRGERLFGGGLDFLGRFCLEYGYVPVLVMGLGRIGLVLGSTFRVVTSALTRDVLERDLIALGRDER
jgi:hypothetical protein